ncbi:hypothetical protein MYX78_03670 [Acidobacteria bacterium AH-259-G07]|nr:hypothetical protein [Acidobacteria bacterium AH-259-G07]
MNKQISPMQFFGHLKWIDGRPLTKVIEPYRVKIFTEALYTFEDGRPKYNWSLNGRAKKNWKSTDEILAMFYRFLAWKSTSGNDSFLLANDEGQAADDLDLAKKLIAANPILNSEVTVLTKEIVRRDGKGKAKILPAGDIAGSHGKTYLFIGYDEIHPYKSWDLFEALAPDPTRHDVLTWITTYASIYNSPGFPLFDLFKQAKSGTDPRFYFSWYSSDFCTDPDFQDKELEAKANPSMESWGNPGYLEQQKKRLPTHKYRRLHLNLPGMPEGAFFDAEKVMDCIVEGRKTLSPQEDISYKAFVDMSGGSSDDACLGVAHLDKSTGRVVVDLVVSQTGRAPFNPRDAVAKFAKICKEYGIHQITGDHFAGQTFRSDFQDSGLTYHPCKQTKHQLYEALEPKINAGEVELLDIPKLQEQILGLTVRGTKVDHLSGEHDDFANCTAGVVSLAAARGYDLAGISFDSVPYTPAWKIGGGTPSRGGRFDFSNRGTPDFTKW